MTDMNQNIQPTDARDVIQRLTQAFGKLPQVLAVVLGGSRAAATSDVASDYDLYVYTVREVPVDFRRTLLGESAEIDNRFWEPGDEWSDPSTGTHIDIMYRSPVWVKVQIERIFASRSFARVYQLFLGTTSFKRTSSLLQVKRCLAGFRNLRASEA
jgi:predicted nucleotidyltransferase